MMATDDHGLHGRRAEVLRLHYVDGLGIRAIARRLRMARKTVRRMLGTGTVQRVRQRHEQRASLLDAHEAFIRSELERYPELRAPTMLERLRERGYTGGISILRDRMRALRPTALGEAFLTQSFAPGQVAMVDWAHIGFVLPGVPRRVSAFVMVLGYSRMLYLEYTLSQRFGTFIRCMERALGFFGGVTLCDVFDNMKTVVKEHPPAGPVVFNPQMLSYAAARGFALHACNPRRGNEKGLVERPISFMRRRFLPGRRFADLADLNRQARTWRDTYANPREHEITGKVPALVFEHEEKAHLAAIKQGPFDARDQDSATVDKTFRVRFDRNRYSVPWRFVGQHVTLRADDTHVDIFLGPRRIARHLRCWSIREDIEDPEHRRGLKEHKPKAAADRLPHALAGLGDHGRNYFRVLAAGGRSVRRETIRLTLLCELFGESQVRDAMAEVMRNGHVGVEYVEYLLRHDPTLRAAPKPLRLGDETLDAMHAHEPDLSVYDHVLGDAPTRNPRDDHGL
jgi:transposase